MNYCPQCGSDDVCYTILCNCDINPLKEEHIWKCLKCGHKTVKTTSSGIDLDNINYSLKINRYLKEILKTDLTRLSIEVFSEKEIKLIRDLREADLIITKNYPTKQQ